MINHMVIQGHLTADPVYRPAENNKKSSIWGKIGVYQGKDNNGNDLPSMFIEFTAFGTEADTLAQYAHKGDLIVASGRFSETQSQGQNGQLYTNKRIVGNARMCYKLPSQNRQQNQNTAGYVQQPQYAQPQPGNITTAQYQAQPQPGNITTAQYQAQPQQSAYSQTTNANQSMWG